MAPSAGHGLGKGSRISLSRSRISRVIGYLGLTLPMLLFVFAGVSRRIRSGPASWDSQVASVTLAPRSHFLTRERR